MRQDLIPSERIEEKIFLIRGKRVMFDFDLAVLYRVETKQLKRAVKRNIARFPDDFMIELTPEEIENLRCQFGTSSWGGRRYMPFVFTEQGVAMLSSVLNSERAIQVNIQIMRTFTKLRSMLASNEMLRQKIEELERKIQKHDEQFGVVFQAIKELLGPPPAPRKRAIGFHA